MVLQGFPCFKQSVSDAQTRLDAVSTATVVVKDLQELCMESDKESLADGTRFASGEGQPTCSQPVELSLSDVLHEVPLLLDLIPTDSLAALLAVNQKHRRQIHEYVRHIAVPDQDHVQTLVNGTWPSLVSWYFGRSSIMRLYPIAWAPLVYSPPTRYSVRNASDAAVSLLVKGHAPEMQHVTLKEGFISPAGIAQLHQAGWNRLQSCCLP